jgi:hypothetical protein
MDKLEILLCLLNPRTGSGSIILILWLIVGHMLPHPCLARPIYTSSRFSPFISHVYVRPHSLSTVWGLQHHLPWHAALREYCGLLFTSLGCWTLLKPVLDSAIACEFRVSCSVCIGLMRQVFPAAAAFLCTTGFVSWCTWILDLSLACPAAGSSW